MAITKIQSESMNLADTYTFTGTVTGAGESNAPSFAAYVGSNQTISDRTTTKVSFTGEHFDTASAYDNSSNYRFTVPSGEGGKYMFAAGFNAHTDTTTKLHLWFYVNGSSAFSSMGTQQTQYRDTNSYINGVRFFNLSAGDYVEIYVRQEQGSSSTLQTDGSYFEGFKISS